MYSTLSLFLCSLMFVNFCDGFKGSGIFLQYERNLNKSSLYSDADTVAIDYNEGDRVDFECSSTYIAAQNGILPDLSWLDGSIESTSSQEVNIRKTKRLYRADDGTKLVCKAVSADGMEKWSIPVSFVLIKSSQPLNIFSILLMVGGGLILAALVIIIVYGVAQRCRSKKCEDVGTEEAPFENQDVIYSVIQKENGTIDFSNHDHAVDIGIDNLSCMHENTSYVRFDSPDVIDDSHVNDNIQNAIRNDNIQHEKRERNRYSSSEC